MHSNVSPIGSTQFVKISISHFLGYRPIPKFGYRLARQIVATDSGGPPAEFPLALPYSTTQQHEPASISRLYYNTLRRASKAIHHGDSANTSGRSSGWADQQRRDSMWVSHVAQYVYTGRQTWRRCHCAMYSYSISVSRWSSVDIGRDMVGGIQTVCRQLVNMAKWRHNNWMS